MPASNLNHARSIRLVRSFPLFFSCSLPLANALARSLNPRRDPDPFCRMEELMVFLFAPFSLKRFAPPLATRSLTL